MAIRAMVVGLAAMLPCAAKAQTEPAKVAQRAVVSAAAALDSARSAPGVRSAVLENAAIIFAAAATQLGNGNYSGAERMAGVAAALAHGAERGPMEIGARIDSIPFGVVPIGPGVPWSAAGY